MRGEANRTRHLLRYRQVLRDLEAVSGNCAELSKRLNLSPSYTAQLVARAKRIVSMEDGPIPLITHENPLPVPPAAATCAAPVADAPTAPTRLMKVADVQAMVQLSRASIYGYVQRGAFPAPIKLGKHSRWIEAEIIAWVESLKAAREPRKGEQ